MWAVSRFGDPLGVPEHAHRSAALSVEMLTNDSTPQSAAASSTLRVRRRCSSRPQRVALQQRKMLEGRGVEDDLRAELTEDLHDPMRVTDVGQDRLV